MYINRHKNVAQERKDSFLNLIKFVKKIIELPPGDRKAIQKLKSEVEDVKRMASLNWLKEKVQELEK